MTQPFVLQTTSTLHSINLSQVGMIRQVECRGILLDFFKRMQLIVC